MLRFTLILSVTTLLLTIASTAQTPQKEGTATIAGIVTLKGEPARGVLVGLQLQNSSTPSRPQPSRVKTDENGRFRITGLAAGQYIVGALAPGFVTDGSQRFGLQGKTVNVSEGEAVENLDLSLKPGGVITGRVTDANGEPVVEVNVRLAKVADSNPTGSLGPPSAPVYMGFYRTDDRGVYRIFGLAAGKYKVSVGLPMREGSFSFQTSRSFIPETFHPDTTDETKAKIIEVEEGQETTDIDIKAADPKTAYEISGRVVDAESGKPIVGVGLSIGSYNQAGRMTGNMSGDWRTDANGEFQILGARPGKYGVFIENREGKSEFYNDPTPVEVISGDVAGVEVRGMRGVSISGTVVIEGTNDPAILARRSQVMLNTSDMANFSAGSRNIRANPDGTFRFGGLPPGKIRLSSYSGVPKVSLIRVEQNGVPVKDSIIETHAGEQVTNIRMVFGYGDGTVRGQVKIVGGTLPDGLRPYISLKRADSAMIANSVSPDDRGLFIVRDLFPGEYEVRISPSFIARPSNELAQTLAKISPRFARARQTATVTNGSEVQINITIDLTPEGNER